MDLERLTHRTYRTSVILAVVLSLMLVTFAALVGRSALNLKGALVLADPTDVTVIATVEPRLGGKVSITDIEFLRKQKVTTVSEKPYYDYLVKTSDGTDHLVRIAWEPSTGTWQLLTFETLHGETGAVPIASAAPVEETKR